MNILMLVTTFCRPIVIFPRQQRDVEFQVQYVYIEVRLWPIHNLAKSLPVGASAEFPVL